MQALQRWTCGIITLSLLALSFSPSIVHASRAAHGRSWKQVTRASWYGREFHGRLAADGSKFNSHGLTAAHRTLRLGTKVKVTDLKSGRSVVVSITDRGPFIAGRGIDLSYAAARQIGMVHRGVARVQVETLHPEPPTPPLIALVRSTLTWLPRAILQ